MTGRLKSGCGMSMRLRTQDALPVWQFAFINLALVAAFSGTFNLLAAIGSRKEEASALAGSVLRSGQARSLDFTGVEVQSPSVRDER